GDVGDLGGARASSKASAPSPNPNGEGAYALSAAYARGNAWSWGESNPRPSGAVPPVLRPFPTMRLTLPHRRVGWPPKWPSGRLCDLSSVFPDAIGLSRRHLPLLLPGCG